MTPPPDVSGLHAEQGLGFVPAPKFFFSPAADSTGPTNSTTLNTNTPIAPCAADCSLRHQSLLAPPITPCASSLGHHFLPSPTNSTTLKRYPALPVAPTGPANRSSLAFDRPIRRSLLAPPIAPCAPLLGHSFPHRSSISSQSPLSSQIRPTASLLPPQAPPIILCLSLPVRSADLSLLVFASSGQRLHIDPQRFQLIDTKEP
ncbi:hypothetical protein PTTG_29831 [Puccinia triticina 1-1 BBBD Race 1]|uniref:Uncharacterized protein n=1 Tax=Puccinia triticina (isolate 1-1 / race 1 (BBBD)) TaxID=630390 RepID=A0A180G1J3_PUCT1|nr:hypothetical protein PTTG_29831 [Puccinia triticina 1-1 BBBD Race 1]